jgi:hypothetical protein
MMNVQRPDPNTPLSGKTGEKRAHLALALPLVLALAGCGSGGGGTSSTTPQAGISLAPGLPDTGQTTCYIGSGPAPCTDTRQDGGSGRDALSGVSKVGGGAAGFDYTKRASDGTSLPASATDWSCVRDNITGLTWEAKTTDGGMRDKQWRYSWYDSNSPSNGGDAGGGGSTATCNSTLGVSCTTEAYVAAVNAQTLCGTTTEPWRLPSQRELLTLLHAGVLPSIDPTYFANTMQAPYWSASPYAPTPSMAWGVHFGYGAGHAEAKTAANHVRLVRGTAF